MKLFRLFFDSYLWLLTVFLPRCSLVPSICSLDPHCVHYGSHIVKYHTVPCTHMIDIQINSIKSMSPLPRIRTINRRPCLSCRADHFSCTRKSNYCVNCHCQMSKSATGSTQTKNQEGRRIDHVKNKNKTLAQVTTITWKCVH